MLFSSGEISGSGMFALCNRHTFSAAMIISYQGCIEHDAKGCCLNESPDRNADGL